MKAVIINHKVGRALVVLLLALFAFLNQSQAQVDLTSGTNAIVYFGTAVNTGASILNPIMLGIIGLMGLIGLWYRFARKGKIGT